MIELFSNDKSLQYSAKLLLKHRVLVIQGKSGVGKTTFADEVAKKLSIGKSIKIHRAIGDGYTQYSSYHPFSRSWSFNSFPDIKDSTIKLIGVSALMLGPAGRIATPLIQFLTRVRYRVESRYEIFTKEEIESVGVFALRSKKDRIFIFDNYHYWDEKSIAFAKKTIHSRWHLNLYIILVTTEFDYIESCHDFSASYNKIPNSCFLKYKGLTTEELDKLLLKSLPPTISSTITSHANQSIPIIRKLITLAKNSDSESIAVDKVKKAALQFRIDNICDLGSGNANQAAFNCLSILGSKASVRDIACSLGKTVQELDNCIAWGVENDLIHILEEDQIVFSHETYRNLFDRPGAVSSDVLEKINICCAIAIPDQYEKRINIAARGTNNNLTMRLLISLLRVKILSRFEEKNIQKEIENILNITTKVMHGNIKTLSNMIRNTQILAAEGKYEDAAWSINVCSISPSKNIFIEEAIIFSHYAYMSRNKKMRAESIKKLYTCKKINEIEIEQRFTVSALLAYGLALDHRMSEACKILEDEGNMLAFELERFKNARLYLSILDRMSLICNENHVATMHLKRAYKYFSQFIDKNGFVDRPEEYIKCATNLCSALVIKGEPRDAYKIANYSKSVTERTDLGWMKTAHFLKNNSMVANIYCGDADYSTLARKWLGMSTFSNNTRIPYLTNALGCFVELGRSNFGDLNIQDIYDLIIKEIKKGEESESYMQYTAHFSCWQAKVCIPELNVSIDHKKAANDLVNKIPYVNAIYFLRRHDCLMSVAESANENIDAKKWSSLAFKDIKESELPAFYRRAFHFNPLEYWLPH
ncbi:hypothetical protein [Teredinibacter turnerae]|uniref:hypothetical protein n=1 Tax=Teredinibacter turnerae TaxID=2426 RepID=UPI00040CE218|nr:hypothetical protein [Teredinibacter turnerae]